MGDLQVQQMYTYVPLTIDSPGVPSSGTTQRKDAQALFDRSFRITSVADVFSRIGLPSARPPNDGFTLFSF